MTEKYFMDHLPLNALKTLAMPVFIKNRHSQYLWANDFFSYPDCGSVVTFIGNMKKDRKSIDTTAIVAHQSDIFARGASTQFISHDTFRR